MNWGGNCVNRRSVRPELRPVDREQVVTFNLLPYDNTGFRKTYRQP